MNQIANVLALENTIMINRSFEYGRLPYSQKIIGPRLKKLTCDPVDFEIIPANI